MMKTPKGMNAVREAIRETRTQEDVCYRLAAELRGEMNRLHANDIGMVSHRMRKGDRAGLESRIVGLRIALTLALGLPPGSHEELDAFLKAFKRERLVKPVPARLSRTEETA